MNFTRATLHHDNLTDGTLGSTVVDTMFNIEVHQASFALRRALAPNPTHDGPNPYEVTP